MIPIHNHSEYSGLDGWSTVKEIAERCTELGIPAISLTDHGTVAGHLEFGKVLPQYDLKPIFGCELYHGEKTKFEKNERDAAHLVALAKNDKGLRNLWKMTNAGWHDNFRFVGRVNYDILKEYSEGVILTSACIQGKVAQGVMNDDLSDLDRYLNIFGEDFFIELHTYPGEEHEALNLALVQVATERGIPMIYANDAHYANPGQYEYHDAYLCMQVKQTIYTSVEDRKMWHPRCLYIMEEYEVYNELDYLPKPVVEEAIANTHLIESMVNAQLPKIERHLPVFVPDKCQWLDKSDKIKPADEVFIELVEEGLYRNYGDPSEEVWQRAAKEIRAVLDAHLEDYFLQTWDMVQFCDRHNIIRGPGRGSSAGSIIAYALGITDVDPLKFGLIFERFYNPGREDGYPDIDSDFPSGDRAKVIEYLSHRWGENNVRQIGTITRLKPKSTLDKTYNAYDVTWNEKEEIKKIVDTTPDINILGWEEIGWDENLDPGKKIYVREHVGKKIDAWVKTKPQARQDIINKWLDAVGHVNNRIANRGIHPSGVVVSDVDLSDQLPCFYSKDADVHATMFNMKDVDNLKFLKQDILGIKTLDVLNKWGKLRGEKVNWSKIQTDDHDDKMWELLQRGLTRGIFQIEDGYARKLCKELKPKSVEDLAVIVALNRPGPIQFAPTYIERKQGREEVVYDHPFLEKILEPTLGFFLYQEQIITFFQKMGYSLSQADAVRKILGKKKPVLMDQIYNGEAEWEGFDYLSMAEKSGISRGIADQIWGKIVDFAKYSFNKSHAVVYACLTVRTLYAKYMDPASFIIASIEVYPDDKRFYISEGRRLDVDVLPPDIYKSGPYTQTVDGTIYLGFSDVHQVGVMAGRFIEEIRDKYDISTPEKLYDVVEELSKEWKALVEKQGRSPKQRLTSRQIANLFSAGAWRNYEDDGFSLNKIQSLEKEFLKVILTDECDRIIRSNSEIVNELDVWDEMLTDEPGFSYTVPAILDSWEVKTVRNGPNKGKQFGILKLEYKGQEIEVAAFTQIWKRYSFLWQERTVGIFNVLKTDTGYHFQRGKRLT